MIFALGAGCADGEGYKENTEIPVDTGQPEQYAAFAYTCRCDCGYSEPVSVSDVCLPEDTTPEEHCADKVCPLLTILIRDAEDKYDETVEVQCEDIQCTAWPDDVEFDGVTGSVIGPDPRPACEGTCGVERCDCWRCADPNRPEELQDDCSSRYECTNEDSCTYAASSCPENQVSDNVCRVESDAPADTGGTTDESSAAEDSAMTEEGESSTEERGFVLGGGGSFPNLTFAPFPRDSTISTAGASMCQPGRGTFMLLPIHISDRNRDGVTTGIMRALQVSGTGTLTDDAWITQIGGGIGGSSVFGVRSGNRVALGATDELLNAESTGILVSGQIAEVPSGVLGGGTPFVGTLHSGTSMPQGLLEMGWTCPEAPTKSDLETPSSSASASAPDSIASTAKLDQNLAAPALSAANEFEFSLGDLGCPVDWPQKFTARLLDTEKGRPRLTVGLLGSPSAQGVVRLHRGSTRPDYRFTFESRGLTIQGEVMVSDGTTAMVRLDEVEYAGVNLCSPGIYPLFGLRSVR